MPRKATKMVSAAFMSKPLDKPDVISILPVELLQEIIIWATELPGRPCLQNLCLVSRQFRRLVQPLLLSFINIGCFTTQARKRPTQLKALSKGDCLASVFAKTIVIDYSGSFEMDPAKVLTPIEATMLGHLTGALRSFKSVKKVIWEIGEHEPSWVHDSIMNTLPGLHLENLVISIHERSFPSLQLAQLSDLRRICIEWPGIYSNPTRNLTPELAKLISQCPKLSHLELNLQQINLQALFRAFDDIPPLSLEHLSMMRMRVLPEDVLAMLRHLHKLKSLGLNKYTDDYAPVTKQSDEVWKLLQAQKIHLTRISTESSIGKLFVSYLESFEGLEHLWLATKAPAIHPVQVLAAVSAHHAHSLVELDLFAEYGNLEWMWPFEDNLKALLPSLYNLKYFGVTFYSLPDSGSSGDENLIHSLISFCEKSFLKLEILTLYFSPQQFWSRGGERDFFKHRKAIRASAHGFSNERLFQAITTHQSVGVPRSTFHIVTEFQVYVRFHDSQTGAFPFILKE